MFLKIKAGSLICFDTTFTTNKVEQCIDDLFINLSLIHQLQIKKCFIQVNKQAKQEEAIYQIHFDKFVDEGILNHFTLFFTNKKDKEFKRIKKAIKALTTRGINMAHHDADIKNPNTGTKGTNKTYDKNQGNKGKQKNPNQKKGK
jgi:hypothetical protein